MLLYESKFCEHIHILCETLHDGWVCEFFHKDAQSDKYGIPYGMGDNSHKLP